jgi:hypothetical protein
MAGVSTRVARQVNLLADLLVVTRWHQVLVARPWGGPVPLMVHAAPVV